MQILLRNVHVIIIKVHERPSCINLVITLSFHKTKTISRGLSNFHKMFITVLKQTFQRFLPKKLVYRDYKDFDRLTFKRKLEEKLNE